MLSPAFKKLLLVMVLAATGAALLLQFINSKLKPLENAPPKISKPDFTYHYTPPTLPMATSKPEAEPKADDAVQPAETFARTSRGVAGEA